MSLSRYWIIQSVTLNHSLRYRTALRKTAIIISRRGSDDHALQAAKGSLRENGKLILCLSDLDLLKMADIKAQGEKEPADFLSEMLDRLLIHLEK